METVAENEYWQEIDVMLIFQKLKGVQKHLQATGGKEVLTRM